MNNSRSFWVTGASNGLGLALVQRLLDDGHRVAASGRQSAELDTLGAIHGSRLLRLPGQLQVPEQAEQACQAIRSNWGALDGLIINAGSCDYLPDGLPDGDVLEAVITTNLQASEHSLTSAVPLLAKGDTPQVMAILNRYSALQLYAPTQVPAGWNNLAQWMREQRKALAELGIGLTVVAPQSLKTAVTSAQAMPEAWTPQTAAQELLRRLPQRDPELVLEVLSLSDLWPLPR